MATKTHGPSRRNLLAGIAAYGAAAPLAMNLSAIGKAAAQAVGPSAPYRALVCIFLQGGNDSNNLLLATDQGSWSQYWAARISGSDPIALMPLGAAPVAIGATSSVTGRTVKTADQPEHWGGVLPITPATAQLVPPANKVGPADQTRTFALHPMMKATQGLFAAGRAAAIANVGTLLAPLTKADYQHPTATTQIPQRLFSHADQQAAWQSGQLDGAATGWGGLMADTFQPAASGGGDFSSITTAGNTPFPQGAGTKSFRVSYAANKASAQTITLAAAKGTYNESATFLDELRASLQDGSSQNQLVQTYAAAVAHSLQTSVIYDGALAAAGGPYATVPAPPAFTDPIAGKTADNPLADQLEAVVQTAAAHAALGVQRQVFFVQYGSFDTHDGENPRQGLLLAQLDHALAYLDSALTQAGLSPAVTAFTASDFNRTFTTNGDGTDHAWGGHHLVVGGAVKGGDIYGAYPTLGVDRAATVTTPAFANPDGVGTALVPTTSVETYMATMAAWMGVTPAQMTAIFPRLANFPKQNLGFMKP
ncbi:MAG TPA: DUF1501 domain-containing protein [Phenylobacterium sp.]|jgi:uncharacterized protein (DUF1501 family)|uniref:DUF1501 domain-containing protein n=1 Tax=Phenylobacterium sp. TaxID=1871053 RepID=UPI002C4B60B1|nr:DUF1501 domain-containing protein [Phenylobacterium sp.]HXA39042.1 DUF1501 domain-containing protein [Phenylobacterium sp.]